MNKNIFILIFISFVLISSVQALDNMGTFKQNSNVRIVQICSDASFINITSVSYPDSSIATSTSAMTDLGNGEFYIDFENTTQLGRYDVRGVSDGCEKTFATYFEVTPSGFLINEGSYISLFGSLFIMIILSIIFLFLAYKSESTVPRVTLYSLGFIGFLMAILYTVIIVQQTLYGFESIISGMESFWFVAKMGITAGIVIFGIILFLILLKAWRIKRGLYDDD